MATLNDLTDVTITAPANGQRLVYQSGQWVNQVVPAAAEWVRNRAWLDLPTVGETEQKFVGLIAVFEQSNFTAFTASAAYTVDWGDGVVEDYASGATALHEYDFADADLAGSNGPVTLTDTGDLVGRTAHGYVNGDRVTLYNVTGSTGPVSGQKYYVISATADTFQIALTPGGSAVTITTDGTATLLSYKQAIVTITPQSGNNLTALNLNVKHTQAGLQAYETGWLDIALGSPNFTSSDLTIGGTETVRRRMLERATLVNIGGVTSMASMFNGCFSLQSVPLFNTSSVTNMNSMFFNCYSLQSVPLFDTAAVTNMSSMFQNCNSLQSVPLFNTAAVTNMNSMFLGCFSLQSVPLFNTAAVTNMGGMFASCSSLQSVPLFNTASVAGMNSMFNGCASLQSVPALNVSAVSSSANFGGMFNVCTSVSRIQAAEFNYTFSVANCKLSAAALDEIYTNLPTVVGQTITVTGNYGTAAHDTTIAIGKGWTVTV